ncbi:MAG: hypothetical protein A3K19_25905 [Lentisphaerae bacterium RIFOXYB12_FULL_65_16]|nr:MAG: hypothetical protein A3K18_31905 [Lentisphaerae bacterium RIFOXYA12_64_32]OGV91406.1 MAG: hypothetical protein A3K19_25905 [Lentisphaerae bacterium RIFOXYB12_FULL_65_16]
MKMSVMLFPFHRLLTEGKLAPADFVRTMKAAGVTAIEPMLSWIDAEPQKWEAFRKTAVDAGMVFSCLDIGVNLVGESEADRNQALDTAVRGVELARGGLGCPIVLLAGSKAASSLTEGESRRKYGRGLAKAVVRTKGSGVTITIEDFGVYPTFAAGAKHCLEVLEVAGRAVRFTFDNGNFLLADDRPSEVYGLLKSRIAHVHIKDFALRSRDDQKSLTSPGGKQYKGCLVGAGAAEVPETLGLLKKGGYKGWVSIEVGGGDPDPVREAVHAAKFITETWAKA